MLLYVWIFFSEVVWYPVGSSVPHTKGLTVTDKNQFGEEAESAQWIGVDLDGTLAEAEPWQGFEHIGKPVPMMMKRLKIWLEMGYRVKIALHADKNPSCDSAHSCLVRKTVSSRIRDHKCQGYGHD